MQIVADVTLKQGLHLKMPAAAKAGIIWAGRKLMEALVNTQFIVLKKWSLSQGVLQVKNCSL